MGADSHANVPIADVDRAHRGSRFAEVRDAVFANPYQRVWGSPGERPLPLHPQTLASGLHGLLPFARHYRFRQATEREVEGRPAVGRGELVSGFLNAARAVCGRQRVGLPSLVSNACWPLP
jgi:hypothetical protein